MNSPDGGSDGPGAAGTAPQRPTATAARWSLAAEISLLVAGGTHMLAALEHLSHDPRFSVFFLIAGLGQLGAGLTLRRSPRPALVGGAVVTSVGLMLLYLVSRTVALELGPHSDRPQDPDILGTIVVVAELVAVATLPSLLAPRWRRVTMNAVLLTGLATWAAWFTGFLG